MKLGFQIKGSAKRKRILEDDKEDADLKKDVILSIEGARIVTAEPVANLAKHLVIPLQKNINQSKLGGLENKLQLNSIDDIAAAELISELSSTTSNNASSQLIIPNNDISTQDNKNDRKYIPILLANQPEELLGINDDIERYKLDISLRPEAMDVKSDAYKQVPVEDFGAALLRGMGWEGPEEGSENKRTGFDLVPREYRLGLGAIGKPPEEKGRGDKKKREREREKWKMKAENVLAKQVLKEGDIVWLRKPEYAGRKAEVRETRGVPGLDNIRVMLESTRESVIVKRTEAVLEREEERERERERSAT
eukprot:CAMPEP_0182438140 /NCGR_PEP_ID=MMETSP1167-20130531/85538_1 /TAXON_ID=2988 /ORGANISM="Mallomonas Sp, Strain CCMP3275" /LENGTH=307 /DNA_ID=CAMNT_0024631339 /DNA_START=82 /DNA_END=1005 /DNA_ORIENTATION=-